jgi:hypothetical protein
MEISPQVTMIETVEKRNQNRATKNITLEKKFPLSPTTNEQKLMD